MFAHLLGWGNRSGAAGRAFGTVAAVPAPAVSARAVLEALADLSPTAEEAIGGLTVPTTWFRWLPVRSVAAFATLLPETYGIQPPGVSVEAPFAAGLAAVDQLRPELRSLRLGWLWLAGRHRLPDGRTRPVLHPLVTLPVRVAGSRLNRIGDARVTALVADPEARLRLESRVERGRGALDGQPSSTVAVSPRLLQRLPALAAYAHEVAAAGGFPEAKELVPAGEGPESLVKQDGLRVVAGVAVYAVHESGGTSRADSLRAWAPVAEQRPNAFRWLYVGTDQEAGEEAGDTPPDLPDASPFLLTPSQRRAVESSRTEPLTLISGAPGTGKSHTVAAIACDALGRGRSVLVAAKSEATVDALVELLEAAPGVQPVVFGGGERRQRLADQLASGQVVGLPAQAVHLEAEDLRRVVGRRDRLRAALVDDLSAADPRGTPGATALATARVRAPRLFDPSSDLDQVEALLVEARGTGGWARRRQVRAARRQLQALAGAGPDAGVEDVAEALAVARAHRLRADLGAEGGLELASGMAELRATDELVRERATRWLASELRSARRLDRRGLGAVAALATALRSGRGARRSQLARLGESRLTTALPLWIGTLGDIDDLLPSVPGLFDLVMLDEASSIDQSAAAAALLRGQRAVVSGDPRQLRHVSFIGGDRQLQVLAEHGIDADPVLAARLDIRRNSAFDVAAGVVPVIELGEHFRADPHLVDFVAERLYEGRLHVATRRPTTESRRAIEVVRVDGRRDDDGVVAAEVKEVMTRLRRERAQGSRDVGVITPFRAQAEAIEAAILKRFALADLEAMDLRVGTAHGFQGIEREVVIWSMGAGAGAANGTWRFIEDPHLFTVLATRARRRLTIVLSGSPPPGGLLEDYLVRAQTDPVPPPTSAPATPWVDKVADGLRTAGVGTRAGYPTGRHRLDLVVDGRIEDIAVECELHPDGPEAHIDRRLALIEAGWTVLDAHASRWADRPGDLILDLADRVVR